MNMMYVYLAMAIGMTELTSKFELTMKLSLFIILFLLYSMPSWSESDHDRAMHLLEEGKVISLQKVLDKAQIIVPGRILEVELESKNKQLVYEVEILNQQGEVMELLFDATTGQHLATEKED